jgi:hypothetical protein
MTVDSGRKGSVFLDRYLVLAAAAHAGDHKVEGTALAATVADLAVLWDCSARSARQTLARLTEWDLLAWHAHPGRAHRSRVVLRVHPVHVYFERARRAEAIGNLAEAAFWLEEVQAACPCIPEVPRQLASVRTRLGLAPRGVEPAPCCEVQLTGDGGGEGAGGRPNRRTLPVRV